MLNPRGILLALAMLCFVLSACEISPPRTMSMGLALVSLALLVGGTA